MPRREAAQHEQTLTPQHRSSVDPQRQIPSIRTGRLHVENNHPSVLGQPPSITFRHLSVRVEDGSAFGPDRLPFDLLIERIGGRLALM